MYVPTFQGLSPADLVAAGKPREECFPFTAPRQYRFYRARNAIFHLFRALGAETRPVIVLMPDFNSGNEVLAVRASGAVIVYYRVGRSGEIDPDEIQRLSAAHRADVLYVIHYLGWPQPMRELVDLCRRNQMRLVEDCALSLFSAYDGRPLGSFGDWSIFCLYKTLPVPNGALLVENRDHLDALDALSLRPAGLASVAGRTADLVAQRVRGRFDRAGAVLQRVKRTFGAASDRAGIKRARVGDIGFDVNDVNLAMSRISARVIERQTLQGIASQRAKNFRMLVERLDGSATVLHRDALDGVCPLFCPLLVPDKPAAAAALGKRGIQALEFWNYGADEPQTDDVRFLRAHILGLPVHQDVTAHQIAYMAGEVARMNLRMPS